MIKFLILIYPVLFFVSCGNESQPGDRPNENKKVTVSCKCQSETEFVRGKGSDKAEAEKSAQEKCSVIFPSATVKDCEVVASRKKRKRSA